MDWRYIFCKTYRRGISRDKRSKPTKIDAVISGYLGNVEIGEAILKIVTEQRQANKDFIFSMDPVMGDVGRASLLERVLRSF